MSTSRTRVKHFIKGRAVAVLRRYHVGRRLIAALSEEPEARIAFLESEVAGLKELISTDEAERSLRAEIERLTAAVGNSALVIADLEDRIADLSSARPEQFEEKGR